MKDHQLKALVAVANSGSIRASARAMNLSQSALTKALRELEEDVGAELIIRSYKGVEFTLAGTALLSCARLALSMLDKTREEIRLMRGGAGVRVAAAVIPLVGALFLPRVLREFERLQPEAEVSLFDGLMTTVLPDLMEGRIDFALSIADPDELPYEVAFEPLAEVFIAIGARLAHPLRSASCWEDLRDARWVLNLSTGSLGRKFVTWMVAQDIQSAAKAVYCASPSLMIELMRRTDLIGVAPALLFGDPLFGHGMERIRVEPMPAAMSLGLITLKGVPLGSAAKSLANLFSRNLKS